jgi:hypothetical protein
MFCFCFQQPSVDVNTEIEPPLQPPPPSTEAPQVGFFDRLKNTFAWNSNEPI